MTERRQVLLGLIELSRPLKQITEQLRAFPWDSERPLVTLRCEHVASILDRFIQGQLSAALLEDWANALEGRDDVAFQDSHETAIKSVIQSLANPIICGPLDKQVALRLLAMLRPARLAD